jgi:hypothetical protein
MQGAALWRRHVQHNRPTATVDLRRHRLFDQIGTFATGFGRPMASATSNHILADLVDIPNLAIAIWVETDSRAMRLPRPSRWFA